MRIGAMRIGTMKIGVMSDSHGQIGNVREAGAFLTDELEVALIVHLGDDIADAQALDGLGPDVIAIPGVFSDQYRDTAVVNRVRTEWDGWRVLLSHTAEAHKYDLPQDLDPQALVRTGQVDLLLHGHTHTPFVREKSGAVIVNPGHLKSSDKRGHGASFACLDIHGRQLEVTVYSLSAKSVLHTEVFAKR